MKIILILYFLLGGLLISGCATQAYVDKKVQALWDDLYGPVKLGAISVTRTFREASMDTDKDGKVSRTEFTTSCEKSFTVYIQPLDIDRDGSISISEFLAYERNGPILVIDKKMDTTGDGLISESEFDTYNKETFSRFLKIYDLNRDGAISKKEYDTYHLSLFMDGDEDIDGYINDAEARRIGQREGLLYSRYSYKPVYMCGPRCVWIFDYGVHIDSGGPPVGYCANNPNAAMCPSPTHPGCTNGDVAGDNCHCYWDGHCTPFF